ncbi:MAG: SDR family NAD(P)-dependent oxidoreductase, partial [Myxococcales bacterium]|nr:SDR family NAD(P)-dependent oxidoreductase [Myxococcales bacterium]
VFGLIAIPAMGAYNSAKFAVRGFTEALRQELDFADIGVSCSVVCPGGVKTNIARSSRMVIDPAYGKTREDAVKEFDRAALTTPSKAAKIIIRGIKGNKRRILVGPDAYAIDAMQRMAPNGYQRLIQRFATPKK